MLDKFKNSVMPVIQSRIIAGIFIVIPLAVTIWLAFIFFNLITKWSEPIMSQFHLSGLEDKFWFELTIRGFSIIVTLTFLFIVGQVAKWTLGRSEIVTLRFEDIKITRPEDSETPSVSILLRRSKTDQDAQGRWLYIRLATWHAIQEWISASGVDSGLLFRGVNRGIKITKGLGVGQIGRIYKRLVRTAGLDEKLAQHISGHSMRVGAAQDLLLSGASLPIIMARGRWTKPDTVMRYVEHTALPF